MTRLFTPALNVAGQLESAEPVPFRLTPNLQHFVTPVGIEAHFGSSLMAIGRTLAEPEFALSDLIAIFLRDEVISWLSVQRHVGPEVPPEVPLRDRVRVNVEHVNSRVRNFACLQPPSDKVRRANEMHESFADFAQFGTAPQPVNQQIVRLVSAATNPQQLCQMDPTWHPWL